MTFTEPVAAATDPSGEIDPLFGRYRLALGRSWKVVLAVALLVGALAAFGVGRTVSRGSARVTLDPTVAGLLETVGLADALEDVPSLAELRDLAATTDEPEGVDVGTTLGESLVVNVAADSDDRVTEVLQALVASMDELTLARRQEFAASLREAIDSDRALLEDRLEQVDGDLAAAANQAVRDSVLSDRQRVADSLTLANRRLAALGLFEANQQATVVSYDPVTASSTRITWFVAGFLLAGLAGVAVVLVRAHGDRRVWSRQDAAALRVGPVLPILPTGGPEQTVAAASIGRAATVGGTTPLLVPVGGPVADDVALQLNGVIPTSATAPITTLHQELIGDPRPVLLVAAVGRTRGDDLVRASDYVATLGGEVSGVVLGGVSERELRRTDG
jgi:hypothetical protein